LIIRKDSDGMNQEHGETGREHKEEYQGGMSRPFPG
jgi:hypothetical protein